MVETSKLNHVQKVILRLFLTGSYENVKRALVKLQSAEIVEIISQLRSSDQGKFLSILFTVRLAGEVLSELPEELAKSLIHDFSDDKIREMLIRIPPDDAVDLLSFLPEERGESILSSMSPEERFSLEKLIIFDEDTAGGLMTTQYIAVHDEVTVEEATKILKSKFPEEMEVYYIYVVDDTGHLVGTLPLNKLVLADHDNQVKNIMVPDPINVSPDTPQEEVARIVANFDLLAIPVVDEDHKLLGVVTFDDVIDVLEEEATEDIYHLANLDTEERLFTPIPKSVRLRSGWLLINLVAAMVAALTVSLFSATIEKYVALAILMPIIANMGGNAGIQSLTVVVRGLALGELDFSAGWKTTLKEVTVGLINGLITGFVMAIIAFVWYRSLLLAVIMFCSMVLTLIIAGFVGALVPMGLKWLKQDPALGSSIFVTMAADVGGFFIFLGLATVLLQIYG